MRFRASIQYTPNTIRLINQVIPWVFPYLSRYLTILVAFALILLGNHYGYDNNRGVFAGFFGLLLIPGMFFLERMNLKRDLEQRKGKVRKVTYYFKDEAVNCSEPGSDHDFPYDGYCLLAEDNSYFYLFIARKMVMLVDKSTLKPHRIDDFKAYMTEKTGLPWMKTTPVSFLVRVFTYRRKKK